ncbi:MAG: hypothetical protein B7Y67_12095 [Polynucleobacter sp. 35-46-11]|uniref:UDP-glucose 4-epimerase family protein n=1 Tax=Polynucleobacter sp. 35-46-11 TaxID=1970425 RepID=UPI000BC7C033|nr:SDR family oxidoreductase [Polynucleobacter sp. 35-46-11]OYY13628.1 MAG: hypothetical protein B7Y67_12095 [Polynucleobacter sp. 35-46-11]
MKIPFNKKKSDIYLITGATGFVGSSLIRRLIADESLVVAAVRAKPRKWELQCAVLEVGDFSAGTNFSVALAGVHSVVHTAARVHIMNDKSADALSEFRKVNVAGTLNLARQAALAGVKRFLFISSIKVNGEQTNIGYPFTADKIPVPSDPYGVSKYEAEMGLIAISKETGMEVVIIRSPLVYGPGVKANFLSMMKWVKRGIPLPLGRVTKNRRSFVFIDNLVSMIIACINHPAAANQIFLVSDDEDLSTEGLLRRMAFALGCSSKLIPVPVALITLCTKLFGRADIAQRLCGSLQVDIKKTKDLIGWSPPVSVDEGLRQTAAHFLKM